MPIDTPGHGVDTRRVIRVSREGRIGYDYVDYRTVDGAWLVETTFGKTLDQHIAESGLPMTMIVPVKNFVLNPPRWRGANFGK
ncbi:MAG: hypothetical protein AB7G06_02845 [Bdellovibrionales bacterium]